MVGTTGNMAELMDGETPSGQNVNKEAVAKCLTGTIFNLTNMVKLVTSSLYEGAVDQYSCLRLSDGWQVDDKQKAFL